MLTTEHRSPSRTDLNLRLKTLDMRTHRTQLLGDGFSQLCYPSPPRYAYIACPSTGTCTLVSELCAFDVYTSPRLMVSISIFRL